MSSTERRAIRDAMAAIAQHGRHLAATHGPSGSLIREARRVQAEAVDVVALAVMAERAQGASWAEVACYLGLDLPFVMEHYRPIEDRWKAGLGVGPVLHTVSDGGQVAHGC